MTSVSVSRGAGLRRMRRTLFLLLLTVAAVGAVGIWERSDGMPHMVARQLYRLSYEEEIAGAAVRYGVDPFLVAAVVKAESGFRPDATSAAGAVGLMQVMPETAEWIASREDWRGSHPPDLEDPQENVELGAYYLAFLSERFGGDLDTVLAAYNAGHGKVAEWIQDASGPDRSLGPDGSMDIPFSETRSFIDKVTRYRSLYAKIHPDAFRNTKAVTG